MCGTFAVWFGIKPARFSLVELFEFENVASSVDIFYALDTAVRRCLVLPSEFLYFFHYILRTSAVSSTKRVNTHLLQAALLVLVIIVYTMWVSFFLMRDEFLFVATPSHKDNQDTVSRGKTSSVVSQRFQTGHSPPKPSSFWRQSR